MPLTQTQSLRILIVEDSDLIGFQMQRKLQKELGAEAILRKNYAETVQTLDQDRDFTIALLDLNLPDAPYGEIVDFVLSRNIPALVFTGDLNPETQEYIWSKRVVDYVYKEGPHNLDYVVNVVRRFTKNPEIGVLVADDSDSIRGHIARLLRTHNYQVYECSNGSDALKILRENEHIHLCIVDCHMPYMDGMELTRQIRNHYGKDEIAIIGMSGDQENRMAARFIKNGANDFLPKSFNSEQFYCRVTQNVEMMEQIQTIKDISNKDYLTGLFNRRYFFDEARRVYKHSRKKQQPLAVAMIDVDFFKKVNDTFGHDAGDEVLKQLAALLKSEFPRPHIVARFGGEEFCALLLPAEGEEPKETMENFRRLVETYTIPVERAPLRITISIGLCKRPFESLEDMIKQADDNLYHSKHSGRNKVSCPE